MRVFSQNQEWQCARRAHHVYAVPIVQSLAQAGLGITGCGVHPVLSLLQPIVPGLENQTDLKTRPSAPRQTHLIDNT